jgi:hypothetical protein
MRQATLAIATGLLLSILPVAAQTGQIPEGFTPIFNHATLEGWHISGTNHHGNTQQWRVIDGVLTGWQDPADNGGILLTGKRYKDFEVYIEVKPDFGCDSGLFLRSNEAGQAYQVMLDYLEGGNIGGVYGERLEGVQALASKDWQSVWHKGDWNAIRARVEGSVPHIQVWLNGTKITDFQDTANHAAGGATDGMIAVQVHGGKRWKEGGRHRFRNMAVKELP